MLNREKYAKEILDIACDGGNIALVDGKPEKCVGLCEKCDFCDHDNRYANHCREKAKEWVNSQYVDWSKVPIDTPILVRNYEFDAWDKKHFAKYEDKTVYAWDLGRTSWSAYDKAMSSYKYAMLLESEDQNGNEQN